MKSEMNKTKPIWENTKIEREDLSFAEITENFLDVSRIVLKILLCTKTKFLSTNFYTIIWETLL